MILIGYAADLLSVSSIGTNELQLVRLNVDTLADKSFQFPLSERTNCNK